MQTVPVARGPMFLQVAQWILDPVGYMQSNYRALGNLFRAYILWGSTTPMVLANDPETVQYILTHDGGQEISAPGDANRILEQIVGRQNVMLFDGDRHRNRRKLVMPPFHGERLKAYGKLIESIARDAIASAPESEPFEARAVMQKITMRVILQAVFGLYAGERYERLEQLLAQRLDMLDTPLASAVVFLPWLRKDFGPWSPGGRIRKIAAETEALLFAEIADRRANPDPDRVDILSLLLAARDEGGNGLSDRDLHDELMGLLVAGHETTATALTWALYWIHSLPEVKEKLLAELDTVADAVDPARFVPLPYLSAVCNETLRIHPVAMLTFPRRVEKPLELGGCALEPGTLLMGCIYLIHHREDLYPQPEQFRPERFLERQFAPGEFLPFGGGARRCVGAALAQYELKIVLGTILTRVNLALANDRPVRPGRRGVTLGQGGPVQLQKQGLRSAAKAPAAASA